MIESGELILVEGRMVLNIKELWELMDLKIFLDTDSDIMLSWKIFKEIGRGKLLEDIIEEYLTIDKVFNEKFVLSQKAQANMVVFNFQQE